MDDVFQQPKFRHAERMTPPNVLKQKVGSGGLDMRIISKAQELLENNNIDFKPQAFILMEILASALDNAKERSMGDEAAIEQIMYPLMQLKAQGGMFHFSLISDIANILINFLETVAKLDNDVMDIIVAHKMSLNAVISGSIKGDGGKVGKELRDALMDACNRYYRNRQ
jgi:hypothetical protein